MGWRHRGDLVRLDAKCSAWTTVLFSLVFCFFFLGYGFRGLFASRPRAAVVAVYSSLTVCALLRWCSLSLGVLVSSWMG